MNKQLLCPRTEICFIYALDVENTKDDKEVFRHAGFYPQEEIEKKIAGMEGE